MRPACLAVVYALQEQHCDLVLLLLLLSFPWKELLHHEYVHH